MHDDKKRAAWTVERNLHLKESATAVAGELKAAAGAAGDEKLAGTGGGSAHRPIPPDLRNRFLEVRAVLFERGLYDPILVRFDSATVPQAPTAEIADQLALIAESL